MNSHNFGVVTIANNPFYYRLAENLAMSCKKFNVPVTLLTDKLTNNPIFDKEIIIEIQNNYFEEVWLLKPKAILNVNHYNIACYVDADSLMLNNYFPCIDALEDRGFMQPNFKQIPEHDNWAFRRTARSVATDYGIPIDYPMPMLNGGYFCWRPGHLESKLWVEEFYKALSWMKENNLGIRDEAAMFLSHMKLKLSQKYYYNTMSCLWTTGNRKYSEDFTEFTCTDEFGKLTKPVFGHYGSCHITPVPTSPFTQEYSAQIKKLKSL
jgi:hypothetical protein